MLLALCCVLTAAAAADPGPAFGTFHVDGRDRLITTERSLFDTVALGRVARRLGAEPFRRWFGNPKISPIYRLDPGLGKSTNFALGLDSVPGAADSLPPYRIAIEADGVSDEWAVEPTQAFLRSAYLEEVLPGRSSSAGMGLNLERKDKGEFWKRTLIFAGYGVSYAREGNPFSPELGVFWPSAMDGLAYALLAVGLASLSEDPAIFASALFLSASVKFTLAGTKAGHVEHYNRIVESGYRIPEHVGYDSLRNRGGDVGLRRARAGSRRPAAEKEPDLGFAKQDLRKPVSGTTRFAAVMLGPAVGMAGGFAYGSLEGGSQGEVAVAAFSGMLLGLVGGIRLAIEM